MESKNRLAVWSTSCGRHKAPPTFQKPPWHSRSPVPSTMWSQEGRTKPPFWRSAQRDSVLCPVCVLLTQPCPALVTQGLQATSRLCLWNPPGANPGVVPFSRGSSQPRCPALQVDSLPLSLQGSPAYVSSITPNEPLLALGPHLKSGMTLSSLLTSWSARRAGV